MYWKVESGQGYKVMKIQYLHAAINNSLYASKTNSATVEPR